jgi:predicted RNA binding protein YcfA (HicA-like mRNA interferase family)
VSKKAELIQKLKSEPKGFTWDDAKSLMGSCGFKLVSAKGGGSGRMFRHTETGQRVRLHEPHPQNTLLPCMVYILIEALKISGDIAE